MGSCFRRGAFRGKWLSVTPVNQASNIFVFIGHFLSLLPHCPPHHLFCLLQLLNLPLASELLLEAFPTVLFFASFAAAFSVSHFSCLAMITVFLSSSCSFHLASTSPLSSLASSLASFSHSSICCQASKSTTCS